MSRSADAPRTEPALPEGLRVLCGLSNPLQAAELPAMPPFDPRVTAWLAALSARLMRDPRTRAYPDVATYAFFCRDAHLRQLQAPYVGMEGRLGRGFTFHIAPGNVPMNFAYSLTAALLAGNACIVKASSRDFAQTRLVCEAFRETLTGEHAALLPYVNVVEYPRERQEFTEAFSAACDVRILWGGDETIRRVRQAPLAPRAFDVTFADRWSLLALDAAAVLALDTAALQSVAQGFYNDTYLFDQNACTAPRLLYWLGEGDALAEAQARFWQAVHAYAEPRYPVDPVAAVDKRIALYRAALTLGGVTLAPMPDNLAVRIRLDSLTPAAADFHAGGGCFLEYAAPTLAPLAPLLTRKVQTLAVLGLDPAQVRAFALAQGVRGVDRIATVGHTLDFALVWDGYDLIETLSRRIGMP